MSCINLSTNAAANEGNYKNEDTHLRLLVQGLHDKRRMAKNRPGVTWCVNSNGLDERICQFQGDRPNQYLLI